MKAGRWKTHPRRSDRNSAWWLIGLLILLLQTNALANSPQQQVETLAAEPLVVPPTLVVRFISIDGGGGESNDGVLTVRGTIGQVQAGESSTCGRSVSNGVWFVLTENDLNLIFASSFELDAACQ